MSSTTKMYVSVMKVFSKFLLAKPLAFSNQVYRNKRPRDLDNHLITIALDWPVKWSYFCSFIFSLNLQSPKLLWLLLSRLFKKHFCTKKRGARFGESRIIYTPNLFVKNCKLLIVNLLWYLFSFIMHTLSIQIISTGIFAHVKNP